MSDKQKKFQPSAGYMVAVHQNILGIRAVAKELDIFPRALASALERAGFQMMADPFDLSADAGKVIELQEKHESAGIRVVKEGANDASGDTSTD